MTNGFLKMPSRDSSAPASTPASRWCDVAGKLVPATMARHCGCKACVGLRDPQKGNRG